MCHSCFVKWLIAHNIPVPDLDKECNQMMDRLVEQMKEKQGVTEELKMQDQMEWVRRMNNILEIAEEIIEGKLLYV